MGMAIGLDQSRRHFGTKDSAFLVGRSGVDIKGLVAALRESEASGVPIAMIGATSAYVYFLKACVDKRMRFRLPAGSRVCDGGGYRGRFGVVTRDDYYGLVSDVMDVPAHHCVNTLGLGETATNYFDTALRDRVLERPPVARHKVSPPWTRTQVYDIETREALPPGKVGLLRHFDLCNLPTVIGVQSDNLGVMDENGGFEIIGRAKVVDGKVQHLPSDVAVGPMGDTHVFRLLEAYVNFSIDFKMGRISSDAEKADPIDVRREADGAKGATDGDPTASCPIAVEDIVAGADDPEARKRGDAAIAAFQAQASEGEGPGSGDEPQ
jgi:hypothetical protein